MQDLSKQNAVVTGAGGGIGRSIALSLARAGVNVIAADIDELQVQSVAEEVRQLGVSGWSLATDVSRAESVEALAAFAYEKFGSIDILVNNAGVGLRPFRASWDTSLEDFRWVMGVNFWGVVHGIRAFIPRMREQAQGATIVNTSSLSSFSSVAGLGAYSASKAAIDALTLSTREELAQAGIPIRLSLLFPGGVRTRLATSERLRPEAEQSEHRDVVPWSSYVATQPAGEPPASVDSAAAAMTFIDADDVGPIVVEGIRRGAPFIATGPPPRESYLARAHELASPFFG